jgi:aminodeoxyfutalosine deaminase
MTEQLLNFIAALPKAELHVHLEGTIGPATLLELAARHQSLTLLPFQDEQNLSKWFQFTDFPHFIEVYLTISQMIRTAEDFCLVVERYAETMVRQHIRYAELTVTPFTHTHIQNKGCSFQAIMEGLESGRTAARRQHNVEINWIFDIPRNFSFQGDAYDPFPANITLEYALQGMEDGVIGLGLGGYEVGAPAEPFAHAFLNARAAGLHSIPHAGETSGPASVWAALHALHADRIGHGVRAIEDPALLLLLRDAQVPLEVNPTSNVCLHVYRSLAEHPLPHLDKMGLLITLNSDDPPLFNTDLEQEYQALVLEFGYTQADLARLARNAFVVSAAPWPTKQRLLDEFDQWIATYLPPEPPC